MKANCFFHCFVFIFIFIFLFLIVICAVPDQFELSYQRAIVRQYDYFRSLGNNKIVLIGGSSLSFGIDLDYMEELTGRDCVILGNHFGNGLLFQLEMAKSNIKSGDIFVIEYMNYNNTSGEGELLLSSVGKRYDLHRFFPAEMIKSILQSYPSYFMKKLNYWRSWGYSPEKPYSISVYDERGNMTDYRGECWIHEEYTTEVEELYKYADFESFTYGINQTFIDKLNEFAAYCRQSGAEVYISFPNYYEKAVHNIEYIDIYNEKLTEMLKIKLISRSRDYIFSRDYTYDAIAHCNTAGARYRTELLYRDLTPFLESEKT